MSDADSRPDSSPSSANARYPSLTATRFDLGAIFADSFRLLRDGFSQYAAIFVLLQLPLVIVERLLIPTNTSIASDNLWAGKFLIIAMFFAFLGLFVSLNVVAAARCQIEGTPRPFYATFMDAVIRFPVAVFACSLFLIVVLAGSIFFLIPGIIFFVYGSLFLQAISLRDLSVITSLAASYDLVRGHWLKVFAYFVAVFAGIVALIIPLTLVNVVFEPDVLVQLLFDLPVAALAFFATLSSVVLYHNLEAMHAAARP